MNKLGLTFLLLSCCSIIYAQNPFEDYDYEPKIGTLSQGKYIEHFDNDSLVRIGSVILDTYTNKIVKFVIEETTFTEAGAEPTVMSRWWQQDPLSDEFPSWSPYSFTFNNPIKYTDPTGMAPVDIFELNVDTGQIEMIQKTDDNFDTLKDEDGNTISEKVDKGLLSDGQNIMKDGLETSNVKGGMRLAVDISMHTKDEVGGVVFTDGSGDKMLNVLPYTHTTSKTDANGKVTSMVGGFSFKIPAEWTSSDGSFTGNPTSAFHTHPGHPNAGKSIIGSPRPSGDDLRLADRNASANRGNAAFNNMKYYIFGAKNITGNGNTSNTTSYKTLGRWRVLSKGTNELLKK